MSYIPYLNSHYFVAPVHNRCLEWNGQIYSYHNGDIYVYDPATVTWSKLDYRQLPSEIEIRDSSLYIKTKIPLNQTKYCICTSQDLFQKGCGCGGN